MALIEKIPHPLLVIDTVADENNPGQVKVVERTIDIKTKTMPKPAWFICKYAKYGLVLTATRHRRAATGDKDEKIENTGCRLTFRAYRRKIENWELLRLVLNSSAFGKRTIQIDPEDPSGFWEDQGWLTKREVRVTNTVNIPKDGANSIKIDDIVPPKEKIKVEVEEPAEAKKKPKSSKE